MSPRLRRVLRRRGLEFEFATGGLALAVLFIGPMWMDFLHNNYGPETALYQALIGWGCTIAALLILGRLIWIYWDNDNA